MTTRTTATLTALTVSALLLLGSFARPAQAQGSGGAIGGGRAVAGAAPKVYVNGRPVDGDLAPTYQHGTLYVPLRFMTEYLGGSADWNDARQQATLKRGTRTVVLTAGSTRATLNGEGRALRYPTLVTKGRTLLPIQEVARLFEVQSQYNQDSRVLFLTSANGSLEPPSRTITRNTQRSDAAGQGVSASGKALRGSGNGQTTNTAQRRTGSIVTRQTPKGRVSGSTTKTKPLTGATKTRPTSGTATTGTSTTPPTQGTAPTGTGTTP